MTSSARTLLGISVVVVLAHLLVLRILPTTLRSTAAPAPMVFTTRTITLNPAPPNITAEPAESPPPAPKRPPKPVRPKPAELPQPDPTPAPEPEMEHAMAQDDTQAEAPGTETPQPTAPSETHPSPATSTTDTTAGNDTFDPSSQIPRMVPAPATPDPITLPGSIRLLYNVTGQVKKMDYRARSELLWQHDGNHYDLRFEVSAFLVGSRVQTSHGKLTDQGLAPLRYADKSRSERAAHFDYDRGIVTFSTNSPDIALIPGAQDRLSAFIQLGGLLAGKPSAFPAGAIISLQAVGPRDTAQWSVEVAGEEILHIRGEPVPTLRLVRPPSREFDSKVELWYAPSKGYLPVRIRLTQPNGDYADMLLRNTEAL